MDSTFFFYLSNFSLHSLEALLMRNAQSAVEIKHWKTLSEEYAEESDKLAIECDVWRTKFMASRYVIR